MPSCHSKRSVHLSPHVAQRSSFVTAFGRRMQMQRTMAASEAKKAAQKQAATGLDAMLEAMNGAKKVRRASTIQCDQCRTV